MLDKAKYINSKGQVLQFGVQPFFINYNDLRDYAWGYDTDSNQLKIQSFKRGITTKKLPVIIKANGDCTAYKNELFRIIEYDVLYQTKGKLFIGDYYMEGYFIKSTKDDYLESKGYTTIDLEFVSEDGMWKKVTNNSFNYSDKKDESSTEPFLTYPFTYPYDYKVSTGTLLLQNTSDFECDFIMRIYGQVTNPLITIGDNDYMVETTVYANEFLVINSKEKTVIRYQPDGTAIDEFNNRSRSANVFNKIPAGQNTIRHNVTNGVDIDLIDERGEPLWI